MSSLLQQIDAPADLRRLAPEQLPALAAELRQFLIGSVSRTGGHLAASLGTVELSIALHYVFATPEDHLVWDVGHQAYAHKILTGRREAMAGLRTRGGISGFPKRSESPYDSFGVGHSSTSISAGLGMALADAHHGRDRRTVVVIGDGALTAGQAFEALNHAGGLKADLLVILNDNEMSISPNVGALSNHLAQLMSGRVYSQLREGGKRVLRHLPGPVHEIARRTEEHLKGMVVPGTLFEELGFNYYGPVDGHDLDALVGTLSNLRALSGPRLLHLVTRKGKGYAPAESNPCAYHGVPPFDPARGTTEGNDPRPTYTQVFGQWLCDTAARDPDLVAITPAMREGSGLVEFSRRYPRRYFDVGIAEQHSLTFAAGLACEGLHPVVAIYSTFLQRGYDQLIHDVALQNLPVTLAVDRAGIVGPDGPTHTGAFDIAFLRTVPNLVLMTPADGSELRRMLTTAHAHPGPAAVRYPRDRCPPPADDLSPLPLGRGEIRRQGQGVALLAFGPVLASALEAAERLDATVANMRFVKPLDEALLERLARDHRLLVSLEENAIAGGAGGAVAEYLEGAGLRVPLLRLGLPDRFVEQGSRAELLALYGLDAAGILRAVKRALAAADDCPPQVDRLIS